MATIETSRAPSAAVHAAGMSWAANALSACAAQNSAIRMPAIARNDSVNCMGPQCLSEGGSPGREAMPADPAVVRT